MEIILFRSPAAIDEVAAERALRADGHGVRVLDDHEPLIGCDLLILDAARWPPPAAAALAGRVPETELLFLVDDLDTKLPSDAAMALLKPLDLNKLVRLVRVIDQARTGANDPRDLVDFETLFSGDSPAIVDLLRKVKLIAQSDASVWLHGELGSCRAVVARAIHDRSRRQGRMFMAVNAAAYPGDALEEHLFGGLEPLVGRADGGTLFIDCVTELSPGVQAKLLRLLEDLNVKLRGVEFSIDLRVIVGDERRTMNVGGRLRRELFSLLRVHELDLPALRERANDVTAMIERMLDKLRSVDGPIALSSDATRALEAYPFPGNVRELAHALTHAAVLARGGRIEVEHLPLDVQETARALPADPDSAAGLEALDAVARRFERDYLLRVLRAVGGNRTRAAKILQLSRKGLWQKLKAHGIAADEGRSDADDDDLAG